MEEVELTAGRGTPRIGWVQVGLDGGIIKTGRVLPTKVPGFAPLPEHRSHAVDPAEALPALSQGEGCLKRSVAPDGSYPLKGYRTLGMKDVYLGYADVFRLLTRCTRQSVI